jgi:hypothetical protein
MSQFVCTKGVAPYPNTVEEWVLGTQDVPIGVLEFALSVEDTLFLLHDGYPNDYNSGAEPRLAPFPKTVWW